MVDYNCYFWSTAFGYPGALNDLNVLDRSPLLRQMVDGSLEKLEKSHVPYNIAGEEFNQLYILGDGIYPRYSRFVKSISCPLTAEEKKFAEWHEASRKDVERAFGLLKGVFHILVGDIKVMSHQNLSNIVLTTLILHNMRVEERVSGIEASYNPTDSVDELHDDSIPLRPGLVPSKVDESWKTKLSRQWSMLKDYETHFKLKNALINHVNQNH